MSEKYDEVSSGIVLFRRESGDVLFLLLHYPAGHWDFPKGHVEKGENEIEAAKRELKEETGIDDVQIFFGFREPIDYYYRTKSGKISHKQVIYFVGETRKKDVKLSYEHKGYEWLPYEKALERITYDNSRKVLVKAKMFLEKMGIIKPK